MLLPNAQRRDAGRSHRQAALAIGGQHKVVLEERDPAGAGRRGGQVLRGVDVAAALDRADLLRVELAPVLVPRRVVRGGGGAAVAADVVVDVGGGVGAPADDRLVAGHLRREPPQPVALDLHPAEQGAGLYTSSWGLGSTSRAPSTQGAWVVHRLGATAAMTLP